MTDPNNMPTDPRLDREDQTSLAGVYNDGLEYLRRNGYKAIPHVTGQIAGHKVYRLTVPKEVDGITYPKDFKIWKEVASQDEVLLLQETIQDFINVDYDNRKLWLPAINPDPSKRQTIYGHATSLINLASVEEQQNAGDLLEYGVDPLPRCATGSETKGQIAPSSFIPDLNWFDDSIKGLQVSDIVTLFPPAELEILSLIIGRGVVGVSGHKTPSGHVIQHTSRMAGIVYGRDPGLGKSYLFNALFNALKSCGYSMGTFKSMNSRFNMGSVATSHFTYKDDVTTKTLQSFMGAEETKIIITGQGSLRVEDKGSNAVDVRPSTVILLCCNEFNPRVIFDIDPGTADRLHILSTYRVPEVEQMGGTIQGSPNLLPEFHLKFLSEKYGVSVQTLMLYLARLCADKFLALIQPDTETNLLKEAIHFQSHRLRKPLYKNTASQVITYMLMPYLSVIGVDSAYNLVIKSRKHIDFPVSDLSWKEVVTTSAKSICDPACVWWHMWLKFHFEHIQPMNEYHPFIGLRLLNPSFLNKSRMESLQMEKSPDEVSNLFSHIRLQDGMTLTKDFVWINESWASVIPQITNIATIFYFGQAVLGHLDQFVDLHRHGDPTPHNHLVQLQHMYTPEVVEMFKEAYGHYDQLELTYSCKESVTRFLHRCTEIKNTVLGIVHTGNKF